MQSNPAFVFMVVSVFFLILVGMVALVLYASRQEAARKARLAGALELSPASQAQSQELFQRVARLNHINRADNHWVADVYYRHFEKGGDLYYFNLFFRSRTHRANGTHSSRIHPLESNALAFVSPTWNLPSLEAAPRLKGGLLAGIGNRIAEAAMEIKHDVIHFPHIPDLEEQYMLATTEPDAARVQPSDQFLRVLASHPNLHLNVGGDILTLSYASTQGQAPDEEKMIDLYKIGMDLARAL